MSSVYILGKRFVVETQKDFQSQNILFILNESFKLKIRFDYVRAIFLSK